MTSKLNYKGNGTANLLEDLDEDRREIISFINAGYPQSMLQDRISVMKVRLLELKKIAEENNGDRKRLEDNIAKYERIINKISELKWN